MGYCFYIAIKVKSNTYSDPWGDQGTENIPIIPLSKESLDGAFIAAFDSNEKAGSFIYRIRPIDELSFTGYLDPQKLKITYGYLKDNEYFRTDKEKETVKYIKTIIHWKDNSIDEVKKELKVLQRYLEKNQTNKKYYITIFNALLEMSNYKVPLDTTRCLSLMISNYTNDDNYKNAANFVNSFIDDIRIDTDVKNALDVLNNNIKQEFNKQMKLTFKMIYQSIENDNDVRLLFEKVLHDQDFLYEMDDSTVNFITDYITLLPSNRISILANFISDFKDQGYEVDNLKKIHTTLKGRINNPSFNDLDYIKQINLRDLVSNFETIISTKEI